MSKKILIIGDGNHQHIYFFVLWMKNQSNEIFEFDLFNTNTIIKEEFKQVYQRIYPSLRESHFLKHRFIRWFYIIFMFNLRFHQIRKKYDIIHIHYVRQKLSSILGLKTKSKNLIVSIWGSDFYRLGEKKRRGLKKVLDMADIITFTNEETFRNVYNYFQFNDTRFRINRFGLQPLEELKKLELSKEECKVIMGNNKNNIFITVGYNGRSEQNHIKIINLIKSSEEIRSKSNELVFLFPITYGGQNSYKTDLKKELLDYNFKYILIEEYMSEREIAILRKATDIFIQLQPTDQLSGAMIEHMYAGNVVITGSWLPYAILKEIGIYFRCIDNIDDLISALIICINNLKGETLKVGYSKDKIYEFASWPSNIKSWNKLYQSLN